MKKVVRVFESFAQSDEANRAYYLGLSPRERLDILLELIARHRDDQDEAPEGFARVYRIIKLGEG